MPKGDKTKLSSAGDSARKAAATRKNHAEYQELKMSEYQGEQTEKQRELAYELWEKAGCPDGRQDEFWHLAGEQLPKAVPNDDLDMAGEDSFPASDPVNHT